MKQTFETQLIARGPNGAWTYLVAPFNVEAIFGSKAAVPVSGTMNGFAFRKQLQPRGDGTHLLSVDRPMLDGTRTKAGDTVRIVLERDTAPRTVEVPEELQAALAADQVAGAMFKGFAYSHQKEFADWVAGAKRQETRVARAGKTVEMIHARERRP